MKKLVLIFTSFLLYSSVSVAQQPFDKKAVLAQMELANKYFMDKWPDTGKTIVTNRERPSNIWTRGVYYEGLMALHEIYP
ncbi:MAG: family 88 glycosyl hydrolase, partial [Flavobacteriales bacterium 32-34-25]